jgi:hypothetical protein
MSKATISPAEIGATTYRMTEAEEIVAELILNVPIFAPFPTFELGYPADAGELDIDLIKNAESLSLFGRIYRDQPAFGNRLVTTDLYEEGTDRLLTCQIKAAAGADPAEVFVLAIRAARKISFHLTQNENYADAPTIANIVCFGKPQIEASGDVRISETGTTTHEFGAVSFSASSGIEARLGETDGASAAPALHYRWRHDNPDEIPEFAGAIDQPAVSFFAPPVDAALEPPASAWPLLPRARDMHCEVVISQPESLPGAPGAFEKKAALTLRIEQLGGPYRIDEAIFFGDEVRNRPFSVLRADHERGIVGLWSARHQADDDLNQLRFARLDQYQPRAGFNSRTSEITGFGRYESPDLIMLPNGESAVIYAAETTNERSLRLKYGPTDRLSEAPELTVAARLGGFTRTRLVHSADTLFIFFYNDGWLMRRLSFEAGWLDDEPRKIFGVRHSGFGAAVDETDDSLWVASSSDFDFEKPNTETFCQIARIRISSGETELIKEIKERVSGDPSVVVTNNGDVRFFWGCSFVQPGNLVGWRLLDGVWSRENRLPDHFDLLKPTGIGWGNNRQPHVFCNARGKLWLFWQFDNAALVAGRGPSIYFSQQSPAGSWSKPQNLGAGDLMTVVRGANDAFWVFGAREMRIKEDFGIFTKPIVRRFYQRVFTKS